MSDLKLAKIIPEGKRILVQLNSIKECKTEGGVILPDTHSEETRIGTIIAIGDEVDKKYQPGNTILVQFFSGTVLHFPGSSMTNDTIRMITQSEIMALIKE